MSQHFCFVACSFLRADAAVASVYLYTTVFMVSYQLLEIKKD